MPKNHRDRPPTYSYPVGVLVDAQPAATADEPPEDTALQDLSPPAASATRAKWVDYATAIGVDVAGLTKAQIRNLVL